jgi:tetratricopeptide (TPR) repeat protein
MAAAGMVVRGTAAMVVVLAGLGAAGCKGTPEQRAARHLKKGRAAAAKLDFNSALIHFKSAARYQPKSAEAHYQVGVARLATGDTTGAISAIRHAHELDPKHLGALIRMAEIMAISGDQGELTASVDLARRALSARPSSAEALNVLAYAEARLNRTGDAERHLLQAMQAAPADLQADITLAHLKFTQGDLGGSARVLENAAARVPSARLPLILLARIASETGRHEDALRYMGKALALASGDVELTAQLGILYMRLGRMGEAEQTFKRLSTSADPRVRPMYGLFLYQSGKVDAAMAEFERLARGGDSTSHARLVEASLATGKVERATQLVAEALRKDPEDWDARLTKVRLLLREGLHAEAESLLAASAHQRPDSADVHYLLGWVYRMRGSGERYRQELDEALRRKPGFIAARLELAQALIAANAGAPALEVLDRASPEDRSTIAYITTRIRACIAAGRIAEARQALAAIPGAARNLEALTLQTVVHLQAREFAKARAAAEEAVRLAPDQLSSLELLAVSHAAESDRDGAVRRLAIETETRPDSAEARFTLGRWLVAAGRNEDARAAFESSLKARPAYVPATVELARLLARSRQFGAARQVLESALAAHADAPAVRTVLAGILTEQGETEGAIEQYRATLRGDMSNWVALNNLAHLLAERRESLDEAFQYASHAYALQPGDPVIAGTLGWIQHLRGQHDDAIRMLETAAQGTPTTRVQYHLAMAYLKVGRQKSGVDMLRTVAGRAAAAPEGRSARELLAQMQ